jgi:UDP-glucose:(heptosyl)LPS alpha-1,3-glucosyltransferase
VKLAIIARPFVHHGGVETATAGLVGALAAHGHEVHLYSPPGQPPVAGVVAHRLPVVRAPSLARALWLPLAVARAVRAADYDVVQSHERTLSQDIYRAGEGCHRAYLAIRGGPGASPYHRVILGLERRIFSRTPRIIAIARRGQEEIRRLYGVPAARLRVVYNGVDLARFHPDNRGRHRAAALAEVGVPRTAWIVLFVGSGFERKGLSFLIEALGRQGDGSSWLIVLGKGDPRAYRRLAERVGLAARIVWAGPRRDVERWYGAADVVAAPSLYEPFGNVHLEALASGVPVIASTAAGGAEVIEAGRNGALAAPRDPLSLERALDRLRGQPWPELSRAARQSAEPFTYAAEVAGYERIYREIPLAKRDFR